MLWHPHAGHGGDDCKAICTSTDSANKHRNDKAGTTQAVMFILQILSKGGLLLPAAAEDIVAFPREV